MSLSVGRIAAVSVLEPDSGAVRQGCRAMREKPLVPPELLGRVVGEIDGTAVYERA
jgi:hypothetical protein